MARFSQHEGSWWTDEVCGMTRADWMCMLALVLVLMLILTSVVWLVLILVLGSILMLILA